MLIPNRHGSSNSYRYGFQGQEKDDELKGEGNSLNYTFRIHDPRVGRFFAVDPLESEFPWNSPYVFSENMVLQFVEVDGLHRGHPRYMRGTPKPRVAERSNRNRQRYGVLNSTSYRPRGTRTTMIDFAPGGSQTKGSNRPYKNIMSAFQIYTKDNINKFIKDFNLKPALHEGEPIGMTDHSHGIYRLTANILDLVDDMQSVFKTQGLVITSNENDGGNNVVVLSKNFNYMPKDKKKQLMLISLEAEYQKVFNKTLNEKLEEMNSDSNNNMPQNLKYNSAYFSTLFQLGDSPQTMFNKIIEKSIKKGSAKETKVYDTVQPQITQGN